MHCPGNEKDPCYRYPKEPANHLFFFSKIGERVAEYKLERGEALCQYNAYGMQCLRQLLIASLVRLQPVTSIAHIPKGSMCVCSKP